MHEHTPDAVPAILTGQNPVPGALPVAQDHPDNIFTLLGGRYGIDAYESVTQLCPNQLCHRQRDSFGGRITSLADDLEVVYGDLVLPKKLEAELPSVTDTWQNFNGAEHDDSAALSRTNLVLQGAGDVNQEIGRQMWQDQRFIWTRWVDGLEPETKPTLYMMHLLMPHYPWRYLPDGKQYGSSLGIDGLGADGDTWTTDPWVVDQGWQRHILQAGFTDKLLGQLIARLKATGIWNKALVVVTADHGVSFIPASTAATVTPAELLGHRIGAALREAAAADEGQDRRRRRRHHRHRPDDRRRARRQAARRLPRRRAVAARPARQPRRSSSAAPAAARS